MQTHSYILYIHTYTHSSGVCIHSYMYTLIYTPYITHSPYIPLSTLSTHKAAMKTQSERFLPYILDDYTYDIETYISREVEPMGKECEQVQIMALTEYLGIGVKIEYLDGRYDKYLSMVYMYMYI